MRWAHLEGVPITPEMYVTAPETPAQKEGKMTTVLAPLTGSDKQVAWAAEIRSALIAEMEAISARLAVLAQATNVRPAMLDRQREVANALAAMRAEQRATWWIDRHGYSGESGMRLLRIELGKQTAE